MGTTGARTRSKDHTPIVLKLCGSTARMKYSQSWMPKDGAKAPQIARARKLLDELPKQVATYDESQIPWVRAKDRSAADKVRVQVLEALAELAKVRP